MGRKLLRGFEAGCLATLLFALSAPVFAQRTLQASPSGAAAGQRVALVIGNAAYKEAPLTNPVNDAADIAKALQDAGFKVTLKRNVGARDMRQAIREFGNELRRAEVGLFYFAGHGIQVRGANYLVPVGADIQSEADAEDLAIDANYALRTIEDSQVKVSIVVLDACRNNPFARSFRSASRGLAQMTAATGSLIAFATSPGSVAADGTGRNGVYTKHLLASLAQPDTDILKVFQRTRAGVVKETGGRQTPWESTSLVGDFYFRPSAAPASPPVAAAAAGSAAMELSYWESIKATSSSDELKAYLEQYPSGAFAGLARARLKALEQPSSSQQLASAAATAAPAARAMSSADLVGRWFIEGTQNGIEFRQIQVRRADGTVTTEFKSRDKNGPIVNHGVIEAQWHFTGDVITAKCRSLVMNGQSSSCPGDAVGRIVSGNADRFELDTKAGARFRYTRVPETFRLD